MEESPVSIYGYLNCHDCRQSLWLGKAIHENHRPLFFHIGPNEESPNWKRESLNQTVWKFLADHCGHRIDARLESDMTEEMFGYETIGGDSDEDVSEAQYLDGWRGIME